MSVPTSSHLTRLAGWGRPPQRSPTPAGLPTWIADHPGLRSGEPQAIAIEGLAGWMVDAEADGSWVGICAGAPTPVAILFGEVGATSSTGRAWGALVGERSRYIF